MKEYQKLKSFGHHERKKDLLYISLLRRYSSLKVIAIHKYLKYKPRKPFEWFPEEVSQARRKGDNNPALKQLGDTFQLKGNSFYGKKIEDLEKHKRITFKTNEDLVDQSFRSPFFEDLEEIHGAFKIRECKQRVNITRSNQCGITVYQLVKLYMSEFYYDCLNKYLHQAHPDGH